MLSLPWLLRVNITLWPEAVLTEEKEYLSQLDIYESLGAEGIHLRMLCEQSEVIVRLLTLLSPLTAHDDQERFFVSKHHTCP